MGRGRAKAKQIKVARKLKYSAPSTDLSALERELRASRGDVDDDIDPESDEETDEGAADDDDPYAAYAVEDDDQDDYGSWATGSSR